MRRKQVAAAVMALLMSAGMLYPQVREVSDTVAVMTASASSTTRPSGFSTVTVGSSNDYVKLTNVDTPYVSNTTTGEYNKELSVLEITPTIMKQLLQNRGLLNAYANKSYEWTATLVGVGQPAGPELTHDEMMQVDGNKGIYTTISTNVGSIKGDEKQNILSGLPKTTYNKYSTYVIQIDTVVSGGSTYHDYFTWSRTDGWQRYYSLSPVMKDDAVYISTPFNENDGSDISKAMSVIGYRKYCMLSNSIYSAISPDGVDKGGVNYSGSTYVLDLDKDNVFRETVNNTKEITIPRYGRYDIRNADKTWGTFEDYLDIDVKNPVYDAFVPCVNEQPENRMTAGFKSWAKFRLMTGNTAYNMDVLFVGGLVPGAKPMVIYSYQNITSATMAERVNDYYATYYFCDDISFSHIDAYNFAQAVSYVSVMNGTKVIRTMDGSEFVSANKAGMTATKLDNVDISKPTVLTVVMKDGSAKFYTLNVRTGLWESPDDGNGSTGGIVDADPSDYSDIDDGNIELPDDEKTYRVFVNRTTFPNEMGGGRYFVGEDRKNVKDDWTLTDFITGKGKMLTFDSIAPDVYNGVIFDYGDDGYAVYRYFGLTPVLVECGGKRAEKDSMVDDVLCPSNGKEGDEVIIIGKDKDGNPVVREITLTEDNQPIPTRDIVDGVVIDKTQGIYDVIEDGHSDDPDGSFNLSNPDGTNGVLPTNGVEGDEVIVTGYDKNGNPVSGKIVLSVDNQPVPSFGVDDGFIIDETSGIFDIIEDGKPDDGDVFDIYNKKSDGTNTAVPCNGRAGDEVIITGQTKGNAGGSSIGDNISRKLTLLEDNQYLPTGDVYTGTVIDKTTGIFDIIKEGKPDDGDVFNLVKADGFNNAVPSNGKKDDTVKVSGKDADGKGVTRTMILVEDNQLIPAGDIASGDSIDDNNGSDGSGVKLFDKVISGKPDDGDILNLTVLDEQNGHYTATSPSGEVVAQGEIPYGLDPDNITSLKDDFGMNDDEVAEIAEKTGGVVIVELEEGTTNAYPRGTVQPPNKIIILYLDTDKNGNPTGGVSQHTMTGVEGDVNQDGKFTVADIKMQQNYLLGKYAGTGYYLFENYYAANVIRDNNNNIYDLIRLKQMLMEKNK